MRTYQLSLQLRQVEQDPARAVQLSANLGRFEQTLQRWSRATRRARCWCRAGRIFWPSWTRCARTGACMRPIIVQRRANAESYRAR